MTESYKLVSVIITCYNYGRYLEQCLESVLSQTYTNIEIIVVNDGSTDNTDEIMRKYLSSPKVRYIRQENAGQANAKNRGISDAKGVYIAFLDADDMWEASKLEKQIPLFAEPSVGVVYCLAKYFDENGNEMDYSMTSEYLRPRRGNVTEWLFFDNFIQFSSSVIKREYLDRFGVFDETLKMGIDWDLWLRISVACKFAFVDEPLFYYRIGHTGQMSKNLEERQRCSDRIMNNFLMKNPGLLSLRTIRHAYAYTYLNRGYYYRNVDWKKSSKYYMNALRNNPGNIRAFKGIVKNLLIACKVARG
jgi:glycosyltransferase involved in cell wall biosynthesis